MRRSFILLSVAAAVVFLLPQHAVAGGSWLEWDRFAYVPGEVAVAEGEFGQGCCGRGTPANGPFYAYAFKGAWPRDGEAFVPEDAIELGPIETSGGDKYIWSGRLEFVVPDLDPGTYKVTHCNDPCTKMLGDVINPPLRIVESETEARTWKRVDDLRTRVTESRYEMELLRDRVRRASRATDDRTAALEARVRDLERAFARRDAPVRESNLVPWVVAIAALALAGAEAGILGAMGRRR